MARTDWGIKSRTGAMLFGGALATLMIDLATQYAGFKPTVTTIANLTVVVCGLFSYFSPAEVPPQVLPPTPPPPPAPPAPVKILAGMPTAKPESNDVMPTEKKV